MADLDRDSLDGVIDAYKVDVDVTLILERLKRTPAERLEDLTGFAQFADELRVAGSAVRERPEGASVRAFRQQLELLVRSGVEFVLIGGAAATLHGSARLTRDLDVVYGRSRENVRRLVDALRGHHPYLRGAPPGLPFQFDEPTVRMGLNFTLKTDLGDLGVLGEVVGGGTYEDLLPHSIEVEIGGVRCRCATLDALISMKRAAGRPKDFEAIAELEKIRDESGRGGSG